MKLSLILVCLTAYLLLEVSAKPAPQSMDQMREIYDMFKEKVQGALDQMQEKATRVIETAKETMQNTFNSAQKSAQNKVTEFEENVTVPQSVKA